MARALATRPDGTGLAYRDETPADRDRQGVLWARVTEAPGTGRPNFAAMHPRRQCRAMVHRLCQVCGGPASRTSRGWLFLLPRPDTVQSPHWPEGELCTKPPICVPCATLAARHCPHLAHSVLVRSRKPRVWGVFGGFHLPNSAGRLGSPHADGHLPYGHPAAAWFLANQVVVELTRCAPDHAPLAAAPRPGQARRPRSTVRGALGSSSPAA
ncbi:hypothetical protein AQ490_04925 [Wenjunlia vitaminophila]|uniref:Uncharacterized protein n=1 Tax=Wenjunlia vitaminophila TaxID=76728 RepID=A0A0T6LPA2_WENVI|nr:hypothetical protein [Wenjunlia vitaminophila]KRV47729.1 hypothetical protein AQ490_04925 [Wenjunlia vitaminophila]